MTMKCLLAAAVAAGLATGSDAQAQTQIPIYDVHVHYSRDAWGSYDAGAIEKILRAAGVGRALVSSSPDDGTLKLRAANPAMFVPMLRPYYEGVNNSTWHRENQVIAYMDERLKSGIYKGVGEFHLWSVEDAQTPVVRRVIGRARELDLFVYVHTDAKVVEAIFAMAPGVKVLWGHAGMSEPPAGLASPNSRLLVSTLRLTKFPMSMSRTALARISLSVTTDSTLVFLSRLISVLDPLKSKRVAISLTVLFTALSTS